MKKEKPIQCGRVCHTNRDCLRLAQTGPTTSKYQLLIRTKLVLISENSNSLLDVRFCTEFYIYLRQSLDNVTISWFSKHNICDLMSPIAFPA